MFFFKHLFKFAQRFSDETREIGNIFKPKFIFWKGRKRKGKERKGRESEGKEGKGREREGKEGKGKERKGKEGKQRETKGNYGIQRDTKGNKGKGSQYQTVSSLKCA